MTVDFLSETMGTRRTWLLFFRVSKYNSFEIRILYSVKISFRNERKINTLKLRENKTICHQQIIPLKLAKKAFFK